MAHWARVYLQRPHETSASDIGKVEIEPLPHGSPLRLHCEVEFMHHGKLETGHVDGIVPENWKASHRAPPMLYVVQRAGE
jgi:hypothetical protein